MSGKEDEVHLAALFALWLCRFVFRSSGGDNLRPTVFKVASYMATRVRFALAGPALASLYRDLGQASVGTSTIIQWSHLYSLLAVYFHTHGEDLDGVRRPGMISYGNPPFDAFSMRGKLMTYMTPPYAGLESLHSWCELEFRICKFRLVYVNFVSYM
ncbi:hypothetical protein H6P81_018464 [Aristolochia fimbriata]|uniref:Aminotransferase-like plant mobile domain-containing protein n=1 Tax=Aristolochia fimbriata TaxID=158543 RepID=A0AAV7E162_ARIFI|nr:hypothetical protein H6P81_018464 [Aristolochia fimbriata]